MNLKRDIAFTLNGVNSRATASADMTVKIVVPTFGSFDGGSTGDVGEITAATARRRLRAGEGPGDTP